jgi:hypothetical protein
VRAKFGNCGLGQNARAILAAFPVADREHASLEIEILDAQRQALHQPQAATVHH